MEPFAQAVDVQNRLDFDLDDREEISVALALEDMSNLARFHAERDWPDSTTAPTLVRTTVIQSVTRWAHNMHGLVVSRAGDEQMVWTDLKEKAGAPYFTDDEVKLIKAAGTGRRGSYFGSVQVAAYGPGLALRNVHVQTDGGGLKPFPFYEG